MLNYTLVGISRRKERINRLNVFPVPDGDTGSNVFATITGGVNAINEKDFKTISELSKVFSQGTLLSARGNSGVITSQIYKGMSVGLEKAGKEITINQFVKALESAEKYAYNSVSNPTKGTILSVLSEIVKEAKSSKYSSFNDLFESLNIASDAAVKNTPNQLSILKESGVVDSGGYSFERSLYGMSKAVNNDKYELDKKSKDSIVMESLNSVIEAPLEVVEGYCTEAMITLRETKGIKKDAIAKELSKFGGSVVVVIDKPFLKIHVHAKDPGSVLTAFQKYGEFSKIKIDNMDVQVKKEESLKKDWKNNALIAVAEGNGIVNEYKTLNAVNIIKGGQTQNPSVKDFLDTIDNIGSKNIVILPNNSNIVLTVKKVVDLYDGKKNIKYVPTKSAVQGLSVSYLFNEEEKDLDVLTDELNDVYENSTYAQITSAIKDTTFKGLKVKKGDYIGIEEKDIVIADKTLYKAAQKMIQNLLDKKYDIISLYYGKKLPRTEVKKVSDFINKLEKKYSGSEFIIKNGGQDIYYWEIAGEK